MTILQTLIIIFLVIVVLLLLFQLLTLPFYFYAMIRGAFYAPTPMNKVQAMLELVKDKAVQRMADVGSGDGRILIAFAQKGVCADGYEINPLLVLRSQWKIVNASVSQKAKVLLKDFWSADFSDYDLITVYGIQRIMPKLKEKLECELKPGALVISNHFQFPNWRIAQQIGDVILYEKN